MRQIKIKEENNMLVLSTLELDSYMYLNLYDGKADTSKLDDNSCSKSFQCKAFELRDFLNKQGY